MPIFDLNHSDTTLDSEDSTKIKQACAYLIEIGKSNDPAKADALQKIHDLSRGQPTFAGGGLGFCLGILGLIMKSNRKTLSNPSLLSNSLL